MFLEDLLIYRLGLTSPVNIPNHSAAKEKVVDSRETYVIVELTISMLFWIYVRELNILAGKRIACYVMYGDCSISFSSCESSVLSRGYVLDKLCCLFFSSTRTMSDLSVKMTLGEK